MKITDKIYVAGHRGFIGSAIVRLLEKKGYYNIITKSSSELDLKNQHDVNVFFEEYQPNVVILAAAQAGNIKEMYEQPVKYLSENLLIETNVINASFKAGVGELLFLSSSCAYPQNSKQPLKEEYLFSGALEPENEAYGLAKLVGMKLCQYYNKEYGLNYITAILTNIYGEKDKFDSEHSHVITAVMKRMHDAKINKQDSVEIWGTGNVYREFLYVDDAADAIIFLLENDNDLEIINVGSGLDLTIKELVQNIKEVVGYDGELVFDTSKPEGVYKRQLNMNILKNLGWKPNVSLKDGLNKTYKWYLENK